MGMAFMQGASEYLNSLPTDRDPQTEKSADNLKYWFPTIIQTLLTLFYVIAGVESWNPIERTLREISPMYSALFCLFCFFVVFGVLNVVTGVFVDSTSESAKKDREEIIKLELQQKDDFIEEVKAIFEEADADGSGNVTWEEFQLHFASPEVLAYFSFLDLDVNEAEQLFNIMDVDGTKAISIDEFLAGIMRLKGGARKMDHLMLMDEVHRISKEVHNLYKLLYRPAQGH